MDELNKNGLQPQVKTSFNALKELITRDQAHEINNKYNEINHSYTTVFIIPIYSS